MFQYFSTITYQDIFQDLNIEDEEHDTEPEEEYDNEQSNKPETETTNPVIENAYIELHTKLDNLPIEIFDYTENTFGILKIKIKPYESIEEIEIKMDYGFIYDPNINTWTNSLHCHLFTSEFDYVFFIKTQLPFDVRANLYGIVVKDTSETLELSENNVVELLDTIVSLPDLLNENGTIEESDLSKYIFHQKTEEMIYKTYSAMRRMRFYADIVGNLHYHKKFQTDIENYFRIMHQYMRYNDLLKDEFMKTMCTEMKVVYNDLINQIQISNDFVKKTHRNENDENEIDFENYTDVIDDDIMVFLPEDEIYNFNIYT
jgi:hypothetical protein